MRQKTITPLLASLLLAVLSPISTAQNMVIKGTTILDVTNGEMIKNHVVIVKDGRIDSVSPARSADIPKGIEVIDLQGHTLLPGLIDMHVHLTSGGGYHGYERLKLTDERRAILGVVHAETNLDGRLHHRSVTSARARLAMSLCGMRLTMVISPDLECWYQAHPLALPVVIAQTTTCYRPSTVLPEKALLTVHGLHARRYAEI